MTRRASVVAQCPPPAEVEPGPCAKAGENCRYDYLHQHKLDGCCAGSICSANADHIPVCQAASEEDVALSKQCTKVARSGSIHTTTVTTPSILTNDGEFRLDMLTFAFYGAGPGGCLNALDLTFASSSSSSCNLELQAELRDGRLTPISAVGFFSKCPGYTGPAYSGFFSETNAANIPFELTFTGLACDGNLVFESYCVAGSFDWHLQGTVGNVTFEDQHLVANGVLCGQEPKGECPAP
jgi:hypothetical protein